MTALAALVLMALVRAVDPQLGGVAVVLVGYVAPIAVMCAAVWGTVVDGMALQARLGIARVPMVDTASPSKTPVPGRRGDGTPSRALRQAVARCEEAERRAQQAACVAMVMLVLSRS